MGSPAVTKCRLVGHDRAQGGMTAGIEYTGDIITDRHSVTTDRGQLSLVVSGGATCSTDTDAMRLAHPTADLHWTA